jgi:hypothetical protein
MTILKLHRLAKIEFSPQRVQVHQCAKVSSLNAYKVRISIKRFRICNHPEIDLCLALKKAPIN